jgi:diguanylate cyclase (GGDEF)-like protein
MAEFFWRRRQGIAAAVLLSASSLLALLDLAARNGTGLPLTPLAVAAVALVVAGAIFYLVPWDRIDANWRLLPAAVVLGTIALGVYQAELAATPYAAVGLSLIAVMVTAYVGFTMSPGMAMATSPAIILTLLLAYWQAPDRLSLALPLVAVPIAAVLAELISAVTNRSIRSSAESHQRHLRLSRLEDVLHGFRRPGSLEQAAEQVAEAAREIFDVDRSTVVLRTNQGELIPVTRGSATTADPGEHAAQLLIETIGGDRPRLVPTRDDHTMLVVPLPAPDAPVGAVVLYPIDTSDPDFTMDLARLFGLQVGIAIEHLFVIDELNRATTLDELTGIGNRRHADALKAALQPGDALVVLDLDGFKQVNDTRGHAAGDQVLQALSAHLQHCLRDSDTSARLGGDEFLIVARRAHADPLAVADRILQGWGLDRRVEDGPTPTLSAGVALHEHNTTPDETFKRADQALYEAKRRGKNQAQLWSATRERI